MGLFVSMDWNDTSHDWNEIACSTNWKGTSDDSIFAVVDRLMKMVHNKPVQISQCNRAGKDNFSHCNLIPRSPKLSNQGSVITLKFWFSLCCCLVVKQTTSWSSLLSGLRRCYALSRCRYQLIHPGSPTWLSAIKTHSSTPSSGTRGTTFKLGYDYTPSILLHASPTRKISSSIPDPSRNQVTTSRKNLPHGLNMANLFPLDFWSYVHRFSYWFNS